MITQNLINCMYLVGLTNESPNVRKIDGSSAKINYYYNSGSLAKVRLQTVESKKDQTYVNTILTTDTTNWDICTFGFGTGNASPTLQDYSLENAIIDDVFEYQTSGYKLNTDYSFIPDIVISYEKGEIGTMNVNAQEYEVIKEVSNGKIWKLKNCGIG